MTIVLILLFIGFIICTGILFYAEVKNMQDPTSTLGTDWRAVSYVARCGIWLTAIPFLGLMTLDLMLK